jgi:hypothetical protein
MDAGGFRGTGLRIMYIVTSTGGEGVDFSDDEKKGERF